MEPRASDDPFKVDVIQCSIVDLRKEKEKNEQLLHEVRKERVDLEKICESVSQKFNQLSDKHCKMQETVKVAQYKVSQSQAQINSQQATNKQSQDRINELTRVIELEKCEEEKESEEFQDKMSELSNQFRNARHFYTDESLQLETSMLEKKVKEFHAKVSSAKSEVENLRQKLSDLEDQLSRKEEALSPEEKFTSAEQGSILSIFTEEKENAEKMLDGLKQRENTLKDMLLRTSSHTSGTPKTFEE